MGSASPAPSDCGPATHIESETPRPLCVLRNYWQWLGHSAFPAPGGVDLEEMAGPPSSTGGVSFLGITLRGCCSVTRSRLPLSFTPCTARQAKAVTCRAVCVNSARTD